MYPSVKTLFQTAALCLTAILSAAPPGALWAQDVQAEKPRVAIFEPEEEVQKKEKPQLSAMTRAIIWGAVEEGLVSTGRYRFLDRSRVRQAVAELNAQRNFDIYASSGRRDFQSRLAADLICLTKVTKEKKGINIHVSIMNVETGEIEHSASDYRATDDDEVIAKMVRELVGRIIPRAPAAAAPKPVAAAPQAQPTQPARSTAPPPPAMPPLHTESRQQVIDDVTRYWERYKGLGTSDRFELGGHVYRIVNTVGLNHFYVAKDDDETWKKFTPGGTGLSIFVTDREDVYVAGSGRPDYRGTSGIVWKNGVRLAFGEQSELQGSRYEHVWVWKFDVFVAGRGFRVGSAYSNDVRTLDGLMLNGKLIKAK
jgi:hypothetical protein